MVRKIKVLTGLFFCSYNYWLADIHLMGFGEMAQWLQDLLCYHEDCSSNNLQDPHKSKVKLAVVSNFSTSETGMRWISGPSWLDMPTEWVRYRSSERHYFNEINRDHVRRIQDINTRPPLSIHTMDPQIHVYLKYENIYTCGIHTYTRTKSIKGRQKENLCPF